MDVRPDALVRSLFEELVRAPSENPPGDERAAAQVVRTVLEQSGWEVRELSREANRPNIVGTLRRGAGRRLVMQGHLDTKPAVAPGVPDRWSAPPFDVTERAGRLYGLGACDTKGGLAAQLAAATALTADPAWSGELVVQAVADEEDGSWFGAELLLEEGELVADGAIVAEPTSCHPSHAQLGNAWAEVTVRGAAAHAGRPEQGEDAVLGARRYLDVLERLVASLPTDELFPGHPRLNVGDVVASGHPGTVAGECRLRCDVRVLPKQDRDDVLRVYEVAAEHVRTPLLQILVERYQGGGCQSHYVDPGEPIVAALRSAGPRENASPRAAAFFGGTDARYFARAGTPAVVYGPGSLDQAHAPDEFVTSADLVRAARELTTACRSYLGEG